MMSRVSFGGVWVGLGFLGIVIGSWPSAAVADEHLPHLPRVSYEAFDYGFRGATRLDAGPVEFEIVNTGKEAHQIQLVKLEQKHTAADFAAAIKADPTHLPAWGRLMGGPNGTVPGSRASTLQVLVPGDYVLVCWMPDAKGTPHLTLGMTKSVTVGGTPGPEPKIVPDMTLTLTDFAYGLSKPIKPGTYTMEVINKGKQVHEALVVKLPPGGSVKAYGDALTPGKVSSGSPPGTPMGGVVGLAPGARAFVTVTFVPGRYGLICLFPDHASGTPHFAKGMAHDFEVE